MPHQKTAKMTLKQKNNAFVKTLNGTIANLKGHWKNDPSTVLKSEKTQKTNRVKCKTGHF